MSFKYKTYNINTGQYENLPDHVGKASNHPADPGQGPYFNIRDVNGVYMYLKRKGIAFTHQCNEIISRYARENGYAEPDNIELACIEIQKNWRAFVNWFKNNFKNESTQIRM